MQMKMSKRVHVARQLLALAREIQSDEGDDAEPIDEAFAQKVRALRQNMTKLAPKKRKRLQQFGIGVIRPNSTVEDLIDALGQIVAG